MKRLRDQCLTYHTPLLRDIVNGIVSSYRVTSMRHVPDEKNAYFIADLSISFPLNSICKLSLRTD